MEYVSKQRVESNRPPPRPLDATAPVFTPTLTPREPVSCLRKLTLPTFSGDMLMWQSFKDSFDAAVHNCPSISKIQKFNYLRAQTCGDAARTIAGLPLTESNYDDVMALLTTRYGWTQDCPHPHTSTSGNYQPYKFTV